MKKKLLYILAGIILILLIAGVYAYSVVSTGFNIDKPVYIYVDGNKDYRALVAQVKDSAKVKSVTDFELLSSLTGYKNSLKSGRYKVSPDMTVLDLVKVLRRGQQSPVRLTFNNIRTKEDFAQRISEQLMISEESLLGVINDAEKCSQFGFDTKTISAMFIPNTYEFYWDISTDNFLQRMKKEYDTFWTDKRRAQAEETGLTPIEVSTLASIVEEECMYSDEYPKVAGLYLNRLRVGQPLQADPTVKFAVGDFSLRRILNKHLAVDSPYNTYLHAGLPPGPIRIPSIRGIDAVLSYDKNDYLYMCAKEDFSGYHNFARTYSEHQQNATRYRKALNQRGIY